MAGGSSVRVILEAKSACFSRKIADFAAFFLILTQNMCP